MRNGYFHAGTYSSFRGRRHGRPLDKSLIPATRLMAYTSTHDQVGNRAAGDRPSHNLDFGQLAVKAAIVLGSPYTAMVFMGEEWGSSRPFQFFTSHPEPEVASATARAASKSSPTTAGPPTTCQTPRTRRHFSGPSSREDSENGEHARLMETYRDLIALRDNEPDLANPWLVDLAMDYDEERRWIAMRRGSHVIACNIGPGAVEVPYSGKVVLAWGEPQVGKDETVLPGHSFAILRT